MGAAFSVLSIIAIMASAGMRRRGDRDDRARVSEREVAVEGHRREHDAARDEIYERERNELQAGEQIPLFIDAAHRGVQVDDEIDPDRDIDEIRRD